MNVCEGFSNKCKLLLCRKRPIKVKIINQFLQLKRKKQAGNLLEKVWLLSKNVYFQWMNVSKQKSTFF